MYRNVVVDQTNVIRILHVDDDMSQGEFLKYFLPSSDGSFSIKAVSDPYKALDELRTGRYDCVVTDYQMPELNGIELATMIRKEFEVPIIIYTGQGSEEVAEAAFSVGIDDYMRKEMDPSHYQVLSKRIRNVVEKKRLDVMYKTTIEETNESMIISVGKKVEFANKACMELFDIENISDLSDDQYKFLINDKSNNAISRKDKISTKDYNNLPKYFLHLKDGKEIIVEASSSHITYNGKNGLITFLRNVTDKERLEKETRESQERFKALFELAPDGIMTFNMRGVVTSINPAFERLTGFSSEEIVGKHFLSMKTLPKTDLKNFVSVFSNMVRGKMPPPFEFKYLRSDGTISWGESHVALIKILGNQEFLIIARDISERKRRNKNILDEDYNEYPKQELDNDLLISVGQLGYLLNEQILSNIKDADEKMKYYFENSEKYNESVQEVNKILSQTIILLDEYKKISEGTILMPTKNVIEIIMGIIENIDKPEHIKINVNKIGEKIFVLFDANILKKILSALLNEIIIMGDITNIDIMINIRQHFLEIEVKNIYNTEYTDKTISIISKLIKNPEVVIIKEFTQDYGGEILLNNKSSSIIIKIPLLNRESKSEDLLEKIYNTKHLKQIL